MTVREKLRWRRAFALALREIRSAKGISQEELALQIGRHRTYVSQLERRLKSPTLDTMVMICAQLKLRLSDFTRIIERYHNNRQS